MKITSWNINGFRAILGKGFYEWIKKDNPDILCLQETKAFQSQMPSDFKYMMRDYSYVWHSGQKPGYAGTATFYKNNLKPISVKSKFEDIEHFHEDGRVVETKFQDFTLLNIYFPNGGTKADGTPMLDYKLTFYKKFIDYINYLRDHHENIIICGDFNICHKEIDIARPKENEHSIGFLPIERTEIDRLIKNNYLDVFRYFYPDKKDQYTWWSYRAGARQKNVGRRLDYFFVDSGLISKVNGIRHQVEIYGSDHCPISIEIDF
ncbi:MAG: exodeoxyribonuclease III [Candidatus Absconditabacterales bacterium]